MPPTPIDPATAAIQHLAKLAAAAAPAPRMLAALEDILIQWAAEDLEPEDLRDRVEALQNDIESGTQAAEDAATDAATPRARDTARAQLESLTAVRNRLADLTS